MTACVGMRKNVLWLVGLSSMGRRKVSYPSHVKRSECFHVLKFVMSIERT